MTTKKGNNPKHFKKEIMTTAEQQQMNEITMKVQKRASEMQKDKKINAIYQSFDTEEEAKNWMYTQALITLMYSPEERIEMAKKKNKN